MANVKISELTALTTPAAADKLVIVDDSEASTEQTKYITYANLQDSVLSHATELPIAIGGTDQIKLTDGVLAPVTDNDVDLGSATYQYKNLYLEGPVVNNSVNKRMHTATPSSVNTISISSLEASAITKIYFSIKFDSATNDSLIARINGASASYYYHSYYYHGILSGGVSSGNAGSATPSGYWPVSYSGMYQQGEFMLSVLSSPAMYFTLHGKSTAHNASTTFMAYEVLGYYPATILGSITLLSSLGGVFSGKVFVEQIY